MQMSLSLLFAVVAPVVIYGSALPERPSIIIRQNACPPVWASISKELSARFTSSQGCTAEARAAIRAAFHDCFPGACDGSLLLAGELNYGTNKRLITIGSILYEMKNRYQVGAADIVQFAAARAIKSCTYGPTIRTLVGRTDSTNASPESALPGSTQTADELLFSFSLKGFSASELSALIGAHTVAHQFIDRSTSGMSLDTTPDTWDVAFYQQTLDGTAPYSFESDISISQNARTGPSFRQFAGDADAWTRAFIPAWEKVALLGVRASSLVDCTSALQY